MSMRRSHEATELPAPTGSAARSSTPPWAPTWWSSCTAKATPASQPPAPGQSSAAPNVPSAAPATAKGAASAATPTAPIGPIAPADLTNSRRGDGCGCSMTQLTPASSTANRGSARPHDTSVPDLNCPRGVLASALPGCSDSLSWADAAPSSRPVPAYPGCRVMSREQLREHREFRSRPVVDTSGAPVLRHQGLGRPAWRSLSQQSRTAWARSELATVARVGAGLEFLDPSA